MADITFIFSTMIVEILNISSVKCQDPFFNHVSFHNYECLDKMIYIISFQKDQYKEHYEIVMFQMQ